MNDFQMYEEGRKEEESKSLIICCNVCGGNDVQHEEKQGRGLPPKDWVRKQGDLRLISWAGTWDIWTCKCGETWKKLRK